MPTEIRLPVREVEIVNFKSIKHIRLECRRINIFIGEPNTGKSNIIEAVVGLASGSYYNPSRFGGSFSNFVRVKQNSDIFYDNSIDEDVRVKFTKFDGAMDFELLVYCRDGQYAYKVLPDLVPGVEFPPSYLSDYKFDEVSKRFKFYRFRELERFDRKEGEFLLPPDGRNLPFVIMTHRKLREVLGEIFGHYGLKLMRDPEIGEVVAIKETEFDIIKYRYWILSDTLRRLMFYISAILTNYNSIIAMEEPEAHAFPFHTKYLARLIALDEKNQYFITTHNPYFLSTIVEEAPRRDLAIFATYYEDYQTKVKVLSEEKLQEILDLGSATFFNIDRLLED